MSIYYEYVSKLFKEKSNEKIANDNIDNAADLYRVIFENAQDHIYIACNDLSKDVFDRNDVAQCLENALNRKVKIFLAISSKQPQQSKSLEILKKHPELIHFYRNGRFTSNGTDVNFVVMDDSGYRYEYNSAQPKAIACANDEVFAKKLSDIFKEAIQKIA